MMEVMEDHEVSRLNLELLPRQTLTEKRVMKKEEETRENSRHNVKIRHCQLKQLMR